MIRSFRMGIAALSMAACVGAYWYTGNTPAYTPRPDRDARDARGAEEWLRMVRADFLTGEYDLAEIQKVRKAAGRAMADQSKSIGLNWIEMGPDNVGGRTRSIVKDPADPTNQTLYAGGVSGGLWRTTDGANTWTNVESFEQNLTVASIAVLGNGHIYVGTGPSFDFASGAGSSGFLGAGLFKSTDGGGSFSLVIGPSAIFDGGAWSEINKIVADPQNSDGLYVGGNAGFKYYDESDNVFTTPAGIAGSASCRAIEVSADGSTVVARINANQCWVSTDGGDSFSQANQGNGDDELPSSGVNRMEFALSPDPGVNNYIYALQASNGSMNGVFVSTDFGQTWARIWPAGFGPEGVPELDIFGDNNQGGYDNVCAVRPNHPDEIWVGGVTLWKTTLNGQPIQIALQSVVNLGCFVCVHSDIHEMTWVNENTCYIGSDGGVYKTTAAGGFFYGHNRDYTTTQYYSVACSPKGKVIGGLQDNGTLYHDFTGNTPKEVRPFEAGHDGFDCDISQMDPNIMFGTWQSGGLFRSNDNATNFAFFYNTRLQDMFDVNDALGDFYTNIRLFEDFDDENSTDSVNVVFELEDGDSLLAGESAPLPYHGPIAAVTQQATFVNTTGSTIYGPFTSDTLTFQDRVTSLFAAGFGGSTGVWVTRDAMNFLDPIEWWQVTTATGNVNCMEWTADGNDLFIGTSGGEVWRVHGFIDNRDSAHCDIASSEYALQVTQILNAGNAITGLGPDPNNSDRLLVTLGNYGGSGKVRLSNNAVSSPSPTFADIWNPSDPDLDGMPVYDGIIHKSDPNTIVVGTEYGIMATNDGGTTWDFENNGIPRVPVFAVRQQIWDWNFNPFGGGYIENPWVIYAGSHGRGIFRTETLVGFGPDAGEGAIPASDLTIFPNPANSGTTIGFSLNTRSEVSLVIYDVNGRMVKRQKAGAMAPGTHRLDIDVSSLGTGAYIAELNAGTVRRTARFVVSR